MSADGTLTLIFDGYCNLCSNTVQFLIRIDKFKRIHFVAGQSIEGIWLLKRNDLSSPETIVLLDEGKVYTEATAFFHLVRQLQAPWKWLGVARLLPRAFSNGIYRIIARNRIRWFGRRSSCFVPDKLKQ